MAELSRNLYIERTDSNKLATTPAKILKDIWADAGLDGTGILPIGTNNRASSNRKKVKVTITVEEVA